MPTSRRSTLIVTTGGAGIASHAGSAALTELADRLGWTTALSAELAPTPRRPSAHGPGRVVRDLVVAIGDGGDCMADLGVLREQPELFGEAASSPTAWRVIAAMTPERLGVLREAHRQARERDWARGAAPEPITLDFDATADHGPLREGRSGRQLQGRARVHPLLSYLDESSEALARILRPGNAGANTASDHIAVLEQAMTQLPEPAWGMEILARADSGGATRDFVNAMRAFEIHFSISFDLTEPVRDAILAMPESAWVPAITQAGEEREGAAVCELANLDLSAWPEGTRAISRRERPHPGAPSSPSPTTRATASRSSSPTRTTPIWLSSKLAIAAMLASRTASVAARTPGCAASSSASSPPTRVWLELVLAAQDLLTLFQRLCLDDLARSWEPKALRHRLLHVAGRVARSGRRVFLRLQRFWHWASLLAEPQQRAHLARLTQHRPSPRDRSQVPRDC